MVDYVVLVMWIGFVFDRKVGAKSFGVVDNLHLVVWVVKEKKADLNVQKDAYTLKLYH